MKEILGKNLKKYVIPSMIITTMGVFHNIIDGFFIGRNIGDSGLAAINISLPLLALVNSIATGIGLGGAVTMAVNHGRGDFEASRKAMGNTITLLFIASLILTVALAVFKEPILIFLGANKNTLPLAMDYITMMSVGCIFQVISLGTNPLLRNIDKPIRAMVFILAGLILNILLNNLFVKELGLGLLGVGMGTILGQCLSALLTSFNLFTDEERAIRKPDLRLDRKISKDILNISTSSIGSAYLPYAVIVITNWQIIKYGGDHALAAYSILSYASQVVTAALQGIAYGAQPLMSFYNGSGKHRLIKHLKKITLQFMVMVAGGFVILAILIRNKMPVWFGASLDASSIIRVDMIISSIAFIPSAIVKFTQSYFYAINQPRTSNILIYLELLLVTPILLQLLPLWFDLNGVWYTTPASQIIMAILAYNLLKRDQLEGALA